MLLAQPFPNHHERGRVFAKTSELAAYAQQATGKTFTVMFQLSTGKHRSRSLPIASSPSLCATS